ncbi:MAG: hypothetical protein M1827_007013 [Pycnora praestabilis]|nr:MAG: hypothetical protein M1827_007013 [Pycnora praestabilis]
MSLDLYERFLANPSASMLSGASSLNYITTLMTINDAPTIIKHLSTQNQQLTKKEERVLDSIAGDNGLCLDVETTLEFRTSGGAYLPGLDDNFLVDRVVTFPVVHIVHFDANQKIQQIRLYWDQGSLLKLVDVIGSRARNWPIRDGKDQARLIASSASSFARTATGRAVSPHKITATSARDPNEIVITSRGHSDSTGSKNGVRDPRASSDLFAPQETHRELSHPPGIAPRDSAKPPPRDWQELFAGDDPSPTTTGRSAAGGKKSVENPIAPKGGSGKNFQPSRLFDNDTPQSDNAGTPQQSPERFRKPHPTKYDHFAFDDGSEEPQQPQPKAAPLRPITSKHASQWDFEDFVTPENVPTKPRGHNVRHFGFGEEDGNSGESPVKHPNVVQPRPDTAPHFEMQDDGTHKGQQQNQPLGNVTNINDHRKDVDSQLDVNDKSPATRDKKDTKPAAEDRKQAVKMMDSNWDTYDQSPDQGRKENMPRGSKNTGIKTAGNGMGGKKGSSRVWGFGDDNDGEEAGGLNPGKFIAGKKQQAPAEHSLWDY